MSPGLERDQPSLQDLVDALSVALDRPVLLDDTDLVPLAFSRQWEVDEVRSESILHRGVSPRVREGLLAQGIATATDLMRTKDDPALGMDARICMPVRDGDVVLGYIWLLAPDGDLTPDQAEQLRDTARRIADQLARHADFEVADETDLLADLRSGEQEVRERAVDEALSRGVLPDEEVVLCLLVPRQRSEGALAEARRVVRRLSVGHAIAGAVGDSGAVVASLGDPVLRMLYPAAVGSWIHEVASGEVVVGQSAPAPPTALHEAARQASIALRVAVGRPLLGGVAAWQDLGADRLVAQLPRGAVDDAPESLSVLLKNEPELTETLAVFLDKGGDVKASSAALSLHRSGLYYRLHRIEDQTGLDLSKGDDRLLAHLALRARGLAGGK